MKFYPVPTDIVHMIWPRVEPLIATVAEMAGIYTAHEILDRLLNRTAQLWVAVNGEKIVMACVTEILNYRRKECNILICSGSRRKNWIGFLEVIKDWARDQGCQAMTLTGRKGWQRVLRDWKMTAVELECRLNEI